MWASLIISFMLVLSIIIYTLFTSYVIVHYDDDDDDDVNFSVCLLWQVPFTMVLKQTGEKSLGRFYETFHGTDISIQVNIFFVEEMCNRNYSCYLLFNFSWF